MTHKENINSTHEEYMRMAFALAKKGLGHVSPNPMVGCVVVKNDRVISTGYHKKAGLPHAEAQALEKIKQKAKGSVLYVNLEPCSHFGKTPPCTDAIVKYGIKEVVAAMQDPNPLVAGKGFKSLKENGIKVTIGTLQTEAKKLNRVFIKNMNENKPYVMMKAGMSIDGRIALNNGMSKWITGPGSRSHAQLLRKECDAIMAGINTITADNPFLDCRADKTKRIKKVIMDKFGALLPDANIFKFSKPEDIFLVAPEIPPEKEAVMKAKGVNIIKGDGKNGFEAGVLKALWNAGIRSLLIEGGSGVLTSFLKAKFIDEAYFYLAPKIMGGDSLNVFGNLGFTNLGKIYTIVNREISILGADVLVRGDIKYV